MLSRGLASLLAWCVVFKVPCTVAISVILVTIFQL